MNKVENNWLGVDVAKVVEKVYHIEELHKILEDVIIDYVNQAVLMSDEELNYDREKWMGRVGAEDDDTELSKENAYDIDVHSLAIWVEQLRRFKAIKYTTHRHINE
jgi:hypothetical protein